MVPFSKDSASTLTFMATISVSVSQALQNCGGTECGEDQRCCAHGNNSVAIRCCKLQLNSFFDNLDWVARKFSGIFILLLLFAMGYFIQRIVCPRPRRQGNSQEPGLLGTGTTASQDSLLERLPRHSVGDITSPVLLPTYEEVKDLPTYEETMMEARGHGAGLASGAHSTSPHCLCQPGSNPNT